MKITGLLIPAILFASCNSPKEEHDKTSSPKEEPKESSLVKCYSYATAADTVMLKVVYVGTSVSGTLVYSLKEKDKNKGTILGTMRGDILVADYTFMSEGVQSVRKVAFKKDGNMFVEGYGDFTNTDSLNFNSSIKLAEIGCK